MRTICPHCLEVNNVPKKDSYKKANCGKCKNSLLDNEVIELSQSNFDEVIVNSDLPVVVDFWAPWCGPCKMMAPTFKSVAKDYPIKAIFAKVNTEDNQMLGAQFGIRSIPTIVIFKNGVEVQRVSGALDENSLKQLVNSHL
jgi:thioredoxin 2